MFVLVCCGSGKFQSAVPTFFRGCMLSEFTALSPWIGLAATPSVRLEPTTARLKALRSTDWARLAAFSCLHTFNSFSFSLSTSCFLCRPVPFCSCFLAFSSAFISFVPFSFVLTPFFLCFLLLFPSFCYLFPCLSFFAPTPKLGLPKAPHAHRLSIIYLFCPSTTFHSFFSLSSIN